MKNRTIAVITHGRSSSNASFSLAKLLQEKGSRVLYIDLNNNRSYIEKLGFEVLPINVPLNRQSRPSRFNFVKRLRQRISANMRIQAFTNYHCDQWLQNDRPDLVLLDSNLLTIAVPLLKHKIPVINISSTLASLNPVGMPPVFSGHFPRNGSAPLSGIKIKLSWMRIFMAQKVRDTMEQIVIRILSKGHELPVSDQIKLLGGSIKRTEYGWRLVAPEIILGPKCIDFSDPKNGSSKLYAGACVYEGRNQETIDYEHMAEGKAFIYCSLGTCSAAYAYRDKFYRCLMEAMEGLTEYQLILQMDEPWPSRRRIPTNVKIFRTVPQLEMLKHAKVFITHGGASSIREGVYYGTPMIVFPGWHDQFGNAARVVYHGIGLRGSMKKISTAKMISMLSDVINSEGILRSVREMRQEMLKNDEINLCTEFIERLLRPEIS